MNKIHLFTAAALLAATTAAGAAPAQSVNLDGSVTPRAQKGPTLAASANSSLAKSDVPSAKTAPVDAKAAADGDIQKRRLSPRLKAERQNLKEEDAARVQAQQQTPATLDREMSMGNKDHTEQVTNLKITVQKK